MSEKRRIIEALKRRMKSRGLTYAEMARRLEVSEASVKRYFSQGRFTLDTLDDMCAALDASLEELLEELGGRCDASFSQEQERALAADDLLFVVFYLAGGGWSFDSIIRHFTISAAQLTGLLLELDRVALIDYRSDSDIRLRVPVDTPWTPAGPLWNKHKRRAVQEFFNSDFTGEDEFLRVTFGPLSAETATVIRRKLAHTQKDIAGLIALEQTPADELPATERYWCVTAVRPIGFSAMSKSAVDAAMRRLRQER